MMLALGLEFVDPLLHALLGAVSRLPAHWAASPDTDFMRFALVALFLLAPACAVVGVYVVNLRMAFFSDAIAHSAFSGVALGFLLAAAGVSGIDPRFTLVAFGLLVGLLITAVKRRTELGTDTVIGVAFSAVIALGIVIISYSPRFVRDFNHYLYGDILLLDMADLRTALVLALVVIAFMALGYNRLLLIGLNEDLARTRGVRTRLYDYVFAALVVLLVTASIRITGLLLVTAMLVVPAAAARNLARSAGQMFWLASAIGLVAGIGGLIASYYLDTAAGATVILTGTLLFAGSLGLRVWRS